MANYSLHLLKNCKFEDGMTFEWCNFTQAEPGTEIAKGVKNLTFKNCNLCNCKLPEDAKVVDCNTRQISRCSHLHPDLPLSYKCEDECQHMVSKEVVTVDGKVIDTIYEYADKRVTDGQDVGGAK